MSDFKDGLNKIANSVKDLSELNVRTFTGTITSDISGQELGALMEQGVADGNMEVVALTNMKIDGDVDQFISNSDKVTDGLRHAHVSAVNAGQESRKATLELFTNAVRKLINELSSA